MFLDEWTAAIEKTFALMAVSSLVAIVIGVPAAAAVGLVSQYRLQSRRLDRARRMLVSIWVAAMLFSVIMPLILHAAVWESTAGKFGWLMKTMTGGNLLWVGWIHGVHGAAIVAIATHWATRNIAPEVIQHSRLDFSNAAAWFRIRLPLACPSVFAAVVIVWLLAATEMSVVNLHSVRTVADQFYLFYALDPDLTSLAVTTWLPIVIGGVPALVWWRMRRNAVRMSGRVRAEDAANRDGGLSLPRVAEASAFSTPASSTPASSTPEFSAPENSASLIGVIATVLAVLASMLVCQGAIAVGLVMQAGHTVEIIDGGPVASWSLSACVQAILSAPSMFASEYAWTLQLAGLTSLVVTPVAWGLARLGRGHATLGCLIDLCITIAFLIPGPIVAFAVVRFFASGIPGGELLATQTLIPTMIAVSVRSGVIAYVILRIGYERISESVWQSARMDCSGWTRLLRIEIPLLWPAGWVALIAVAVVASGDVPATLPVLPPGVTTVGTRLFGLLHSGSRYQEASLAFWYLFAVLALGMIAWRIMKRGATLELS